MRARSTEKTVTCQKKLLAQVHTAKVGHKELGSKHPNLSSTLSPASHCPHRRTINLEKLLVTGDKLVQLSSEGAKSLHKFAPLPQLRVIFQGRTEPGVYRS